MGAAVRVTSDYAMCSVQVRLTRDDEFARDLLKRSGIVYDLVDLSKGIGLGPRARLSKVRQTPTLMDGEPRQSYTEISEISEFVKSNTSPRPN